MEFNLSIDTNFSHYLNSAALLSDGQETKAKLPLSGIQYSTGVKVTQEVQPLAVLNYPQSKIHQCSLLSPFAWLSGKTNTSVGKHEIRLSFHFEVDK